MFLKEGIAPSATAFPWTVTQAPTPAATILVGNWVNGGWQVYDTSDAPFTISQSLTVIAPNGGEDIPVGSTYTIRWHARGLDPNGEIIIAYRDITKGTDWVFLKEGIAPSATSFPWTVTQDPTAQATILVGNWITGMGWQAYDTSDAPFTIK